jgi:hypothetical protein
MQTIAPQLVLERRTLRNAAAVLLLGLFLLLKVLVVSESLHHSLHADSLAPDHHCVITLLAQGQFSTPGSILALVAGFAGYVFLLPQATSIRITSPELALAPTRGPPCV